MFHGKTPHRLVFFVWIGTLDFVPGGSSKTWRVKSEQRDHFGLGPWGVVKIQIKLQWLDDL